MQKKQKIGLVKIGILIQILLLLLPETFALAKIIDSKKIINIEHEKNSQYEIQYFNEETKQLEYINSAIKYYVNNEEEKNIAYCISKSSKNTEKELNLENINIINENFEINNIENQVKIKENNITNGIQENILIDKSEIVLKNVTNNNVIASNIIEESIITANDEICENILEEQSADNIKEQYIIENSEILSDERITRILENTYPQISLEELGIEDINDAYMITEQAIKYVLKNKKLEDFATYYKFEIEEKESPTLKEKQEIEVTEKREEKLLKGIEKLINIAYNVEEREEKVENSDKYIVYQAKAIEDGQEFTIIVINEEQENSNTNNFINDEEKQQLEEVVDNNISEEKEAQEEIAEEIEKIEVQEDEKIENNIQAEENTKEEVPAENKEKIPIENPSVYIKQECKNTVKADEEINYQFEIKNTGNTKLSNFTWYSILPTNYVTVIKMLSGEYNQDVNYSIYYNTNKKSEYILLKQNINSKENVEIDLAHLNLEIGERIDEIKVCFDEVETGLYAVTKPCIYAKISEEVEDGTKIKSYAILDGYNQDYKVSCEDNIEFAIYNVEKKNKLPRTGF